MQKYSERCVNLSEPNLSSDIGSESDAVGKWPSSMAFGGMEFRVGVVGVTSGGGVGFGSGEGGLSPPRLLEVLQLLVGGMRHNAETPAIFAMKDHASA